MKLTKSFEEVLILFFTKHKERNLKIVPDIIRKFRGNEEEVIRHLCKKYHVDINTVEGADFSGSPVEPVEESAVESQKDAEPTTEVAAEGQAAGDEPAGKPKSKKKLIMIIVVVVAALGTAGFIFKDTIMGMFSGNGETTAEPATTETKAPAEAPAETPAEVKEPAPADTAATDTTATDTTAAAEEESDTTKAAEAEGKE